MTTSRYPELELARHYVELTHYAGVFGGDRLGDASETATDGWATFLKAEAERDGLLVQHISLFWHDWFDQFVLLVAPDGSPYDLSVRQGWEARKAATERDWGETLDKARRRAEAEVERIARTVRG